MQDTARAVFFSILLALPQLLLYFSRLTLWHRNRDLHYVIAAYCNLALACLSTPFVIARIYWKASRGWVINLNLSLAIALSGLCCCLEARGLELRSTLTDSNDSDFDTKGLWRPAVDLIYIITSMIKLTDYWTNWKPEKDLRAQLANVNNSVIRLSSLNPAYLAEVDRQLSTHQLSQLKDKNLVCLPQITDAALVLNIQVPPRRLLSS